MAAVSIVLLFLIFVLHFKTILMFGLFSAQQAGVNDITKMYFPARFFFGNSLYTGEFPLWNNNIFLGFPIHAEGQGGFLYPLNILFAIFPQWIAYNYVYVLHIFFAGFFMYLFVKEVKLKKISAVLAAVIFCLSGFFACHAEHMNLLNSCIWIPLGFLFIIRKKYLLLSAIFALQLLSGFPQIGYYTGIVLFFWLLFNTRKIKDILNFLLSAVFAIEIAFCQVLPTIELIPHSIRTKGVVSADMFSWGYYVKDLLLFIYPYIFGNPVRGTYRYYHSILYENCAFVGIMTLLLVIIGFIKNKKEKFVKFFYGIVIGIILFLLVFPLISKLVSYIPCFNFFRLPQRFLVFVAFSLAIVSASGFQTLKRFKIIVFSIILLELINFGFDFNKVLNLNYFLPPASVKFLRNDKENPKVLVIDDSKKAWIRNYILSTQPETNYISQKSYLNYLPANINTIFNISSINIYSPLAPVNESEYLKLAKSTVKYIFSSSVLNDRRLVLVEKIYLPLFLPELKIYCNNDYISHAIFVDKKTQKKLPLQFLQYQDSKIEIEKDINKDGTIILSDYNYPGWRVFVDGLPARIKETDVLTRAVSVNPNSKKIVFIFMPVSFTIGILVSIFSILFFSRKIYKPRPLPEIKREGCVKNNGERAE
ncbi:MAG: YfhO family protein [Elusimicrobiota bacterium]